MPGRALVPARRGGPALEGPAVHDREPEDRHHRRRRAAGVADSASGSATPSTQADHVVLATGSEPKSLPGLEIDGERVITSDDALVLDRVPGSVIILGGGVIGVEFASVWRSFGAEVTIVEMLPAAAAAGGRDEREGAAAGVPAPRHQVRARREVRVGQHTDTGVTVTLEGGKTLDADLLLVAVGRGPVSAGPRLRGERRGHGARLRQGGPALPDEPSRRSPRSAT